MVRREEAERTAQINRGNEMLLNRLVEISNRKKVGGRPLRQTSPHSLKPVNPYRSLLHSQGNVRSLNELVRKKEEMEILRENTNIARRILSKWGLLSIESPSWTRGSSTTTTTCTSNTRRTSARRCPSRPTARPRSPSTKGGPATSRLCNIDPSAQKSW